MRKRWFRRALADARERRRVVQIMLSRGIQLGDYRVALLLPNWVIARWSGHHWKVFDKAATFGTLQWRYGGHKQLT